MLYRAVPRFISTRSVWQVPTPRSPACHGNTLRYIDVILSVHLSLSPSLPRSISPSVHLSLCPSLPQSISPSVHLLSPSPSPIFFHVLCSRSLVVHHGNPHMPVSNHQSGSHKGKPNKRNKEYNPDIHCGVWLESEGRHCVKSLTCKVEPSSVSLQMYG